MPMVLTAKQERFCQEYLIDLNATQAAIRAGYSKRTAYSIGDENLRKPEIQKRVQQLQKDIQTKTGITQERVLKEYARIAFIDLRSYFDNENRLIDVSQLDDDAAAALSSVEIENQKTHYSSTKKTTVTEVNTTKKIKVFDKKGALDSLAKHLGMFEKDNAQKKTDLDFTKATITFK